MRETGKGRAMGSSRQFYEDNVCVPLMKTREERSGEEEGTRTCRAIGELQKLLSVPTDVNWQEARSRISQHQHLTCNLLHLILMLD